MRPTWNAWAGAMWSHDFWCAAIAQLCPGLLPDGPPAMARYNLIQLSIKHTTARQLYFFYNPASLEVLFAKRRVYVKGEGCNIRFAGRGTDGQTTSFPITLILFGL